MVRNRFKRGISWLQWPVPNPDSDLDDLHAPSTRALELNVEVLRTMTIELDGNNIEIPRLEKEAHSRFINKDSGSLGCVGFISWLQTRQCVRGCFGLCLCMYVCGGKCMNSCVVSLSISSFPLPSSPRLNCLCLHTPFSSFTYLIFYLPMCLCLFSPSPIWPLLYMHKIVQIFIHRLLLYPGPKFPVYFKGFPDVMTSCILALSLLCLSLSLSLLCLRYFAGQIKKLYEEVKFEPKDPKSAYKEAWDLRRLYTFAFRRQLDAYKRGQTPRDSLHCFHVCIIIMFVNFGVINKSWKD